MENRIDELSKAMATGLSRRAALGRMAGIVALAVLGPLVVAAQAGPLPSYCKKDKDCPPGYICCNCKSFCHHPANGKICSPGYCMSACGCSDPG